MLGIGSPIFGSSCKREVTAIVKNVVDHPTDFLVSLVYKDIQEGMRTGDFSKAEGHVLLR